MRKLPESPFQAALLAPTWLGDSVMSTALIPPLREFSGRPVDVWARPMWCDLFRDHPDVREVLPFNPKGDDAGGGGIKRWRNRFRELECAPELIYVTPPSLSAARAALGCGIKYRLGGRGQFRSLLLNRSAPPVSPLGGHWIDQHLEIMTQCGVTTAGDGDGQPRVTPGETDREHAAAILESGGVRGENACIFIAGATYGPAKRWPHFLELGVALPEDMTIIVVGSGGEAQMLAPLITKLRDRGRRVIDLCGKINIIPLGALFKMVRFTVANDTGTMHLAAAVGGRVLGLFTSTWPGWTAPRGGEARWLHAGTECSPCFKRECPLDHLRCLDDLDPTQVIGKLGSWLEGGTG